MTMKQPRVLFSVPEPGQETNPYITLLRQAIEDCGGRVEYFSWSAALKGDYDVVHFHWPEHLLAGRTPIRTAVNHVRYLALLARVQLAGKPVVRTVHNQHPHERSAVLSRALLRWTDRITGTWVVLNASTEVPRPGRVVLIPHGHYGPLLRDPQRRPAGERISLLFLGLIRAYKGVDVLLDAFKVVESDRLRLRIVGKPVDPEYGRRLVGSSRDDTRVSIKLEYVDQSSVEQELAEADLVVLPYKEMHNSGVLLLALSAWRRVLVPRTPANAALAQEIGTNWVLLYEEGTLVEALRGLADRELPSRAPDLSARDWPLIGAGHVRLYSEAIGGVGGVANPGL